MTTITMNDISAELQQAYQVRYFGWHHALDDLTACEERFFASYDDARLFALNRCRELVRAFLAIPYDGTTDVIYKDGVYEGDDPDLFIEEDGSLFIVRFVEDYGDELVGFETFVGVYDF